jgi:hypothetical protein
MASRDDGGPGPYRMAPAGCVDPLRATGPCAPPSPTPERKRQVGDRGTPDIDISQACPGQALRVAGRRHAMSGPAASCRRREDEGSER